MVQIFRLAACDPGKRRSNFALLDCEIHPHPVNEIRIMGGKEWGAALGHLDYTAIERDIVEINEKRRYHEVVIERNNTGDHVIDSIRSICRKEGRRMVPIFEVSTVATQSKEPELHPEAMWKEGTADYAKELKDRGVIKIPATPTQIHKRLEIQMQNFLPHYGTTGHRKYYAEGGERDDLVMCMLLICHRAKRLLGKKFQPKIIGKSAADDYWQNAAPKTREEKILSNPRIKDMIKSLGVNVKETKVL